MTARDFISDVYGYNNLDAGAQWDKPNTGRSKAHYYLVSAVSIMS